MTDREIRENKYARMKRESSKTDVVGYVRVRTSHGDLSLQLFCSKAPRTCHNFLTLCERGYYDNVTFHRLIVSFMIQGGDPTGTGTGGESAWDGRQMRDEISSELKHDARGILSMANHGLHTNGSQFFILFTPQKQLDGKHSVFGRVVGGMETLNRIETIPTDKKDRPQEKSLF
eukprot:GABV01001154.1.p1 GENE.GABV01001154.1~~GABV01001154.1.p1  ORF type:complete len:174 (+),score=51.84 GABV01001154.1:249-770(+)